MRDTDKPVPLETVHAERFSEQQYMYTLYRQTILYTDKPASSNRSRRKVFGTALYTLYTDKPAILETVRAEIVCSQQPVFC